MRVALLLVFVAATASAQKESVSPGRVAGQIAAGTLMVPIGFGAGYYLGSGFNFRGQSNTGLAVGFAGALLGPPAGVAMVGTGSTRGSFGAAIGGTALGYLAGGGMIPVLAKVPDGAIKKVLIAATVMLPAIGASVAYNATRK